MSARSCADHARHRRYCRDCVQAAAKHDSFASQTEAQFATAVEDALNLYGWLWMHQRPAMKQSGRWVTALSGTAGFPDYFAVRGERALAIELKRETEGPTEEQWKWLYALLETPVETFVLRPSGFDGFVRDISGGAPCEQPMSIREGGLMGGTRP